MLIDVFIDALKNSAFVLPFLFIIYVFVALIEKKYLYVAKLRQILQGKYAPVMGAGVGLIPKNGFTILATDLYLNKKVSLGTLVAVLIVSSGDAIPVLLSNFVSFVDIMPILGIQIVFAMLMGYLTDIITAKYQKDNYAKYLEKQLDNEIITEIKKNEYIGSAINVKANWANELLLKPLLYSFKIFGVIFATNLIFGYLTAVIGIAVVISFLSRMSWYQPAIIGLAGLIPGFAVSVVIAQIYVLGGITIGACISGLCVSFGTAGALLFKKSDSKLGCIVLIAVIYVASVITGTLVTLLYNNF